MISIQNFSNKNIGILVSIKNGAWFELPEERGLTDIANSIMCRLIADALVVAGIPEASFWTRGATNADHVRIAIFCRNGDAEKVFTIVRDCLTRPMFAAEEIQEEMRVQRKDYARSLCNPYSRAVKSISRNLSNRNPSVFGMVGFYLRGAGPSVNTLTAYWEKLWSASARDVLLFGSGAEKSCAIVASLSNDATVPTTCTISTQHIFSPPGRYGVSWHESCYNPLYNILDTIMVNRAETLQKGIVFSIVDRGTLRAYVVTKLFGAKKAWDNVFAKDVSVDEWQRAKGDWMAFITRVLSGEDLYNDIFEWDDCTPAAYGNPGITSLQSLAAHVEKTSYEEFIKYWNATIKTA